MADNVFGAPITDETLKEMEKYKDKDPITRFDRAHEALNMKTDGTKHKAASDYVKGLKDEYGDGVSTLCLFYNATGDPLTLDGNHSWHGYLWKGTYPQVIANGQWGAFLHVKPDWPNIHTEGSSAGVVYKGQNTDGSEYNFMFSWYNPWRASNSSNSTYNKAYTHILEVGSVNWNDIQGNTEGADLNWEAEEYKCAARVTIGDNTTSDFEAILTLQDA